MQKLAATPRYLLDFFCSLSPAGYISAPSQTPCPPWHFPPPPLLSPLGPLPSL